MDPGYLSRLLGKFERDGLLQKKTSEQDGRYAELTLTARGRSVFKKLNALSNEQARTALQGLPPTARTELIHCMGSIESILMQVDRRRLPYVLRPHRVGDMGWIVYREGLGYAEQYGWDETFEALAANIVSEFVSLISSRAGNGAGSPRSTARTWATSFWSSIRVNPTRRSFASVCRAERPRYRPRPRLSKRVRPFRSHTQAIERSSSGRRAFSPLRTAFTNEPVSIWLKKSRIIASATILLARSGNWN